MSRSICLLGCTLMLRHHITAVQQVSCWMQALSHKLPMAMVSDSEKSGLSEARLSPTGRTDLLLNGRGMPGRLTGHQDTE